MATKVYNVFDDEWQYTMGSKQMQEFAIEQIMNRLQSDPLDDILEEVDSMVTDSMKSKVSQLLKNTTEANTNLKCTSDNLAIELLKLKYFTVEQLHVE